jgi:hypothetical protein
MSRIRAAIFAFTAATALIAASGPVPALADDVAVVADDAAAKQVAAANDARGPIAAPEAVAAGLVAPPPLAPAKPKAVRAAQAPVVVRQSAPPQPHWDCSGFWCGRQFVLMLGVGY